MNGAVNDTVPKAKRPSKKEWMTEEIFDVVEERRKAKFNPTEYSRLHKPIRQKCREAREEWFTHKCREIERLERENKHQVLHENVKEITFGKKKKNASECIRDKDDVPF